MPRIRTDIDNESVLAILAEGKLSLLAISRRFGCSASVIRQIKRHARNVDLEIESHRKARSSTLELCTCCGIRPKAKGNVYLCRKCFENAPSNDSDDFLVFLPKGTTGRS